MSEVIGNMASGPLGITLAGRGPPLRVAFTRARAFIAEASRGRQPPTMAEVRAIYRMAAAPGQCIVFRCKIGDVGGY